MLSKILLNIIRIPINIVHLTIKKGLLNLKDHIVINNNYSKSQDYIEILAR